MNGDVQGPKSVSIRGALDEAEMRGSLIGVGYTGGSSLYWGYVETITETHVSINAVPGRSMLRGVFVIDSLRSVIFGREQA